MQISAAHECGVQKNIRGEEKVGKTKLNAVAILLRFIQFE
jgi:hypothetical protein